MFRRRPLARAAMIGGGAYMVGKRSAQKGAQEDAQDAQIEELQSQQDAAAAAPAAASAAAPAGGLTDSAMAQLEQLAKLKQEGVLTEDEFEQQKQKILGAT